MAAPPDGYDDLAHYIHYTWEAALSVLGGLIMRRWNKLEDKVEEKLDKAEFSELKEEIREWKKEQQNQHVENRHRLDRILERLPLVHPQRQQRP